MRTVTKYISDDGLTFDELADCLTHEAGARDCARRMLALVAKTVDVNDPDHFVQQDKATALDLQRWCVGHVERVARQQFPDAMLADVPCFFTIVGRYADDCGPAFVRPAVYRLQCMDDQFREWGQPYFALQANKRGS